MRIVQVSALTSKQTGFEPRLAHQKSPKTNNAHAGSRTRVTSMGGLYDTATLHAPWCATAQVAPNLSNHVTSVSEHGLKTVFQFLVAVA